MNYSVVQKGYKSKYSYNLFAFLILLLCKKVITHNTVITFLHQILLATLSLQCLLKIVIVIVSVLVFKSSLFISKMARRYTAEEVAKILIGELPDELVNVTNFNDSSFQNVDNFNNTIPDVADNNGCDVESIQM